MIREIEEHEQVMNRGLFEWGRGRFMNEYLRVGMIERPPRCLSFEERFKMIRVRSGEFNKRFYTLWKNSVVCQICDRMVSRKCVTWFTKDYGPCAVKLNIFKNTDMRERTLENEMDYLGRRIMDDNYLQAPVCSDCCFYLSSFCRGCDEMKPLFSMMKLDLLVEVLCLCKKCFKRREFLDNTVFRIPRGINPFDISLQQRQRVLDYNFGGKACTFCGVFKIRDEFELELELEEGNVNDVVITCACNYSMCNQHYISHECTDEYKSLGFTRSVLDPRPETRLLAGPIANLLWMNLIAPKLIFKAIKKRYQSARKNIVMIKIFEYIYDIKYLE